MCRSFNFVSDGHGISSRGGSSRTDIPDGCEKDDDNAVFPGGRLIIAGGYDANSHKEEAPSTTSHVSMHECSSNGFNAESSVGVAGSGSANARRRETQNGNAETHTDEDTFFNGNVADGVKKVTNSCNGDTSHAHVAPEHKGNKPAKRAFCKRCEKAQDLCICGRFKGVVQNKVKITILQNPKEKQHAVGSVRVALLGLENVALVDVPEIYTKESFRIRPKVPGSKRSLAGRGGKKLLLNGGKAPAFSQGEMQSEVEALQVHNLLIEIFNCQLNHHSVFGPSRLPSHSFEGGHGLSNGLNNEFTLNEKVCMASGNVEWNGHLKGASNSTGSGPLWIEDLESLVPSGVALLYPSDKAVELSDLLHKNNEQELEAPSHLLVLDGTWSKARRLYLENPWLQNLPHYKLSLTSPSLYEGVRKQPKPGCLSTLESIVYALKVLEPDNIEGLDGLLEVFMSMVEDQRRCKQMKGSVQGNWM